MHPDFLNGQGKREQGSKANCLPKKKISNIFLEEVEHEHTWPAVLTASCFCEPGLQSYSSAFNL